LIEIIQISKFAGPVFIGIGDTINVEHKVGNETIMFRKWPREGATIVYSILIRNEYGCLDVMLTDANGPMNLGQGKSVVPTRCSPRNCKTFGLQRFTRRKCDES
jgi:hypothetical protein